MKRQLEIVKHVNRFDESIFLLYHWINKGDIKEVKLRYSEDMEKDIDLYNKRFNLMADIYQDITEKLSGKRERIEYYFKERYSQFATYGSLAILWSFHSNDNTLIPYEERMKDMNEATRVKIFADVISDEESANTPSEELKTLPDLIQFIDNTSFENEYKWEAIKIFHNPKPYYNEVYQLLSEVMEQLNQHTVKIEELEKEFYHYWSDFQKDNDIVDTIDDKLNISWNSERDTAVVPLLFIPYGITISISDPVADAKDIIRINFMIDKNFDIADHKLTKEDIVDGGAMFSDKSKMDIMEFISKKPCYGKEIANELNLSTATISYHVNSLLKVGFVKADLISNKVFYSLDKDRIVNYLDDMKEYFNRL